MEHELVWSISSAGRSLEPGYRRLTTSVGLGSACGPSAARGRGARALGGGAPSALRNAGRILQFTRRVGQYSPSDACTLNGTACPEKRRRIIRTGWNSADRLLAGLLRAPPVRSALVCISRRRYDSPEIVHCRDGVRGRDPAHVRSGGSPRAHVQRQHDRIGCPSRRQRRRFCGPSRDGGGIDSAAGPRAATRRRAPEASETAVGRRRHRRRRFVDDGVQPGPDALRRTIGRTRSEGASRSGTATPRSSSGSSPRGDSSASSGSSSSGRSAASGSNDSGPSRRAVPAYSRPRGDRPVTGEAVERGTVPPAGGGGGAASTIPTTRTIRGDSGARVTDLASAISSTIRSTAATAMATAIQATTAVGVVAADIRPASLRRDDTGSVRLKINPKQAQIFIDGYYVGIVDSYDGAFQKLLARQRRAQGGTQGGRLRAAAVRRARDARRNGHLQGRDEADPVSPPHAVAATLLRLYAVSRRCNLRPLRFPRRGLSFVGRRFARVRSSVSRPHSRASSRISTRFS